MPQVLKDDVRDRILDGALRLFAQKGYANATMSEIAEEADVSTGNIYRYFGGKRELFRTVLPDSFVRRFRALLRERTDAAGGVEDVGDLPPTHAYSLAAGRMLDFSIEHRLRVLILLGHGRGTRYEDFRDEIVEELASAAVRHFRGDEARLDALSATLRFDLEEIYRNFVGTLVRILNRFEEETAVRDATAAVTRYHLTGLAALLR